MAYQPKSYRKFVATAATATLVASAIAPAAMASSHFEDVAPKYKDAVDYLVNNGISQGTTESTFGTHENIKRGDLAIWLAKALKLDTASAPASGFEDTAGTRYDAYVSVLKSKGYISGKSTTEFAPNATVTRGEMAIMLSNAYDLKSDVATSFTDAVGNYKTAIQGLYAYEVTSGKTETTFGTSQNITRGDLAIFLKRAAEVVKTPEVVGVSAVNATQVQVKFGVEVAGGTNTEANLNTNYKIGAVSPASAVLQADKKTVLLTFNNASEVEVTDAVLVVEPIATAKDASVKTVKHTQVFTYEDTVRPVVTSTTYSDFQNAVIHFSEPMSNLGTVTVSNANVVVGALAADGLSVPVSLTAATEGSYTVTMVGATDKSNNLITPNPVTVNLVKSKTDTVAPTVTSVTTSGTSNLSVKFSEALSAVPVVTVTGGGATTVTQDLTDLTKYNVALATPVTGVQTVSVTAGYTDPSGNAGAAYSTLAQFTADSTAPTYVSHSVQTIAGVQYLVVGYNEAVDSTTGAVSGTYTDANSVTHTAALGATSLYDANGDGVNDSVKVDLTANTAGNYTVTLPAGLATDASINASASKSVSFALGSVANTTKPVVTSVVTQTAKSDVNKFTVNFGSDVTAGTALNVNNYTVEGQTVFSSAIFDGDQRTVTLTLKDGAITTDGLRNFSVNNVSGVNGVVMDAHTEQVLFDENVKPTITSATLTASNTVALNFSELMTSTTIADAVGAGNDFEVYINGVKATVDSVIEGTDASKYIITLNAATVVNNLSDTVTVNVLNTNDVTDAGTPVNELKTTGSITVTK